MMVHLSQKTNEAFDRYVQQVESELKLRWDRKRAYFWVREHPEAWAQVQKGEVVVKSLADPEQNTVPDGLIHDWLGAELLASAKMDQVLRVLQDFDSHKKYFPQVIRSKTVSRSGDTVIGYWRVQQRVQLISAVVDVEQTAQYGKTDADHWHCKAVSTRVSEVENAGSSHEKVLPRGEGHGYIWRLNAYWTLEQGPEGVYAECRTVSLSRDIPAMVLWAVKPFIESFPRDSLLSTMKGLRQAVSSESSKTACQGSRHDLKHSLKGRTSV
jgi:hypothetical protein